MAANFRKYAALLAATLTLAGMWWVTTAFAQQTPSPSPQTPTSPFDLSGQPTPSLLQTATAPPSLTGVNGYADRSAVVIRSGPGIGFSRLGVLAQGRSIDIIGYNGYSLGRACSPVFQADLDMWVMVEWNGGIGWMARCALRITGERNMRFMLRNTSPEGAPPPTGYVTPVPTQSR